ncbi:hypothetical protein AMATHDRAFT_153743 [Amanita thiersii Skay4041]|uniref:Cytochrome P450 n=1 Tax=Amanita thiersii Skay4041 TaxID=703135 RepID=A0A2A9NEX9_9AGAR|nr:hypothetical protein AMATHDRAFT_153743 [Amanita thiersii Skay4041]
MWLQLSPGVVYGLIIVSFVLWGIDRRKRRSKLPLPPGPKGLPIVGLWNMPRRKPWLVYEEWSKIYGDMMYFEAFGQSFLILSSMKRVKDLLEKRSANYSDRPRMVMVLELMDWTFNLGLLPYGSMWRRQRKAMHEHFHINAVDKYKPVQMRETRAFIRRLQQTPELLRRHIRHAFGALILDITYGIRINDHNDPYVVMAEESLAGLAEAGNPLSFLVDMIPALKYIPSWFPGGAFKKQAEHYRSVNKRMVETPFDYVKARLADGTAKPSVATAMIESLPDESDPARAEEELIARDVTGVAYVSGVDTTGSSTEVFFLAMASFPEVQKRAQAELDAVIGPHRLPTFEDRESLPYINALARETMRWLLVLPGGVSHMVTEDDEYNGYHIPKGTIVLGNAWAILHDPEMFPDPHEFKPERFIKNGKFDLTGILDPHNVAFGFGRRVCLGRNLSDNSLFITIASVLSVFDILPPVDGNGNPVKPSVDVTEGFLSHPVSLNCILKPRSPMAAELIRSSELLDNE